MPLQPCRECHVRVSTEAATCPRCGCPNPTTMSIPQEKSLPLGERLESHTISEGTEKLPESVCEEQREEVLSAPPSPKYIVLRWLTLLPVLGFSVWLIDLLFFGAAKFVIEFFPENSKGIVMTFRSLSGVAGRAIIPILTYCWAPWGKLKVANTLVVFSAVMMLMSCSVGRIPIPVAIAGFIGLSVGWLAIRRKDSKPGGGW